MAQVMPILAEEEKRRKALAFQAAMAESYMARSGCGYPGVTEAPEPLQTAAEGRGGRGGSPSGGLKNRGSSAAARAPQAGGRWPTGPQSNRGATGSSAPEAAAADKGAFRSPPSPPSGDTREKKTREQYPEIPESRKTKPNRRENEFMLNLMILRNTLHKNAPETRERARLAGRFVWRDIRLMTKLVDKIQDALLRTMPKSRDEYYSAYAMHGHYELHIDGPVRTARHLLVTDKHLAAMAEAAMKSECILCMKEGCEIDRCELREALLESAAPTAIQDGDSLFRKCEYRDAAGQLVQGKDVTV